MIDDKLREILDELVQWARDGHLLNTNVTLAQIKQAFQDENSPKPVSSGSHDSEPRDSEIGSIRVGEAGFEIAKPGQEPMTGQYFYDRFEKELEDKTVRNSHGCFLAEGEQYSGAFFELEGIKRAARKAANL